MKWDNYLQHNRKLKEQEWNYGPNEKLINIYWSIFTDKLIEHGKIKKVTRTFRLFLNVANFQHIPNVL